MRARCAVRHAQAGGEGDQFLHHQVEAQFADARIVDGGGLAIDGTFRTAIWVGIVMPFNPRTAWVSACRTPMAVMLEGHHGNRFATKIGWLVPGEEDQRIEDILDRAGNRAVIGGRADDEPIALRTSSSNQPTWAGSPPVSSSRKSGRFRSWMVASTVSHPRSEVLQWC